MYTFERTVRVPAVLYGKSPIQTTTKRALTHSTVLLTRLAYLIIREQESPNYDNLKKRNHITMSLSNNDHNQYNLPSSSFDDDDDDADGFMGWNHDLHERRRSSQQTSHNSHNSSSDYNVNVDDDDPRMNIEEHEQEHEQENPESYPNHHDKINQFNDSIITRAGESNTNIPVQDCNESSLDPYDVTNTNNTDDPSLQSQSSASSGDRWSLNIRINSAIDLPSSIIPTMPLCPFMKFALITVTEEDEILDLEKSSAKFRRQEFEQKNVNNNSNNNNNVKDEEIINVNTKHDKHSFQRQESLRIFNFSGKKNGSLANFQNNVPLEHCILYNKNHNTTSLSNTTTSTTTPEDNDNYDPFMTTTTTNSIPQILQSSYKIMSKKDNGMMEWHEEMRWDDIELPLQTVLCIELSAKAVFPPSTSLLSNIENSHHYNSHDLDLGGSGIHHYDSRIDLNKMNKDDPFGSGNSSTATRGGGGSGSNSAPSSGNGGLLGFWRKGRGKTNGMTRGVGGGGNGGVTNGATGRSTVSSHHGSDDGGVSEEMEKATAAAAVARYLMGHKSQSEIETDRDDNIKVGENDISNTNNRNEEKQ